MLRSLSSGLFSILNLNFPSFVVFVVIMLIQLIFSSSMLQNNLHELWSLLNFLLPEIFSSAETFDEWFQISGENDQQEVVQQLHKVRLKP